MNIDEYALEVEGRIHAITMLCSVLIAYHPDQAGMRKTLEGTRKVAEEATEPRLAPYNKGIVAVLVDFERALETRAQAEQVKNLEPGPPH